MRYEMEELIPVTGKLVEQYTGGESTSVTYEKAEQLMEAVLYCIHEMEQANLHCLSTKEKIPADLAYETGLQYVEEKVKNALDLYNQMLPEFVSYENECIYDTFVKGIPEFFRRYDSRFEPQNTILTLDYPVMKELSGYQGIDKIYEFLRCICAEQRFLNALPGDYVRDVLLKYNRDYHVMIDNLCEIVYAAVLCRILAGKNLSDRALTRDDYDKINQYFKNTERAIVTAYLGAVTKELVKKYYDNDRFLMDYLMRAVKEIAIRLPLYMAHQADEE